MYGFVFFQCVVTVEEDKFTFWKIISKNEQRNVYRIFSVPYKRNHILTCSAKYERSDNCIGIDICDGRVCRVWNGTFYQGIPLNNSNELCQRYIKVIYILLKTLVDYWHLYIQFTLFTRRDEIWGFGGFVCLVFLIFKYLIMCLYSQYRIFLCLLDLFNRHVLN